MRRVWPAAKGMAKPSGAVFVSPCTEYVQKLWYFRCSPSVTTGEPVFLRLVPRLRLVFDYDLDSSAPIVARGRISLAVRLSDGGGWERIVPISPERAFTGPKASASGVLDLAEHQRTIADLRELTGSSQTAYSRSLLPRVDVVGRAVGTAGVAVVCTSSRPESSACFPSSWWWCRSA